jgi:hypothetical protein
MSVKNVEGAREVRGRMYPWGLGNVKRRDAVNKSSRSKLGNDDTRPFWVYVGEPIALITTVMFSRHGALLLLDEYPAYFTHILRFV